VVTLDQPFAGEEVLDMGRLVHAIASR
jgi:hypothetical protein